MINGLVTKFLYLEEITILVGLFYIIFIKYQSISWRRSARRRLLKSSLTRNRVRCTCNRIRCNTILLNNRITRSCRSCHRITRGSGSCHRWLHPIWLLHWLHFRHVHHGLLFASWDDGSWSWRTGVFWLFVVVRGRRVASISLFFDVVTVARIANKTGTAAAN